MAAIDTTGPAASIGRRLGRRSSMAAIVARRLAIMVPTLFGIVTITFVLTHVLGGNPARQIAGQAADASTIAHISHLYGFDKPLIVQYWNYITGILHGNLGISTQTGRPVRSDLVDRFPATLELILLSLSLALAIGVPLGAWAGSTARRSAQGAIRGFTFVFLAIPDFWLALVALYFFFFRLGWLPGPTGQVGLQGEARRITGAALLDALLTANGSAIVDAAEHVVLPVGVLGLLLSAPIARLMRSSMLTAMESDYIRFGTSAGLAPFRLWRYAVRGALPPVITFTGTLFTLLLGGTVLIETVFSWGGAAQYAANAIQTNDFTATQGFVLVCGLFAMVAFLVVDLIQLTLDPRIRMGDTRRRRSLYSIFSHPRPFRIGRTEARSRRAHRRQIRTALSDAAAAALAFAGSARQLLMEFPVRGVLGSISRTVRSRNVPLFAGTGILALMIAAAYILPPLWNYGVSTPDPLHTLSPPGSGHIFGTDTFGFDLFIRVIYAARIDLSIAAKGVLLSAVVGVAIGLIVGFSRREYLDNFVMRIVDMVQAFPVLIVAVALVTFAGNSLTNVVWALAFINTPIFLRLTRSQVHTIRELRYIEVATALGNGRIRILLRHVLPNALGPAIVQVGISLGYAILTVAGLAFLGVGVQAPTPEWGSMILTGKDNITTGQWWTVVFPGLAVLLSVAAFNLLAEGVERARNIYS